MMTESFYITREVHTLRPLARFLGAPREIDRKQRSRRSKPTYYARFSPFDADEHGLNIICWGRSLRRVKIAAKRELALRAECRSLGFNPDERDD
jgi:hypothetical protein